MTILFLSRLFYPHRGGVEKHVFEVGKRLVERGYTTIVLTELLTKSHSLSYHKVLPSAKSMGGTFGIRMYQMDRLEEGKRKKFRIWLWLWRHRSIIEKTDIVHCHDMFFWYLPFRFLYPGKRVYTTFHGYETKFPPSKKAVFIRKMSEKLSFGNICVGDYIKKWYGTKPTFVTYGGIDKIRNPKSSPRARLDSAKRGGAGEIRNNLKPQKSKLKILFIGRLENDTGIPIYLDTLKLLKEKGVEFTFEACGDGSLRAKVAAYGKVHGFVSEVAPYIEKADVVFASSYLCILEAFAARRSVFAAYQNPLKEDYLRMAPFAPFISIEADPRSLANKLEAFTRNPHEKDALIHKAYDWVVKHSWDDVADLYEKLWRV